MDKKIAAALAGGGARNENVGIQLCRRKDVAAVVVFIHGKSLALDVNRDVIDLAASLVDDAQAHRDGLFRLRVGVVDGRLADLHAHRLLDAERQRLRGGCLRDLPVLIVQRHGEVRRSFGGFVRDGNFIADVGRLAGLDHIDVFGVRFAHRKQQHLRVDGRADAHLAGVDVLVVVADGHAQDRLVAREKLADGLSVHGQAVAFNVDRRRGRGIRLFVAIDDVDKARHLAGLLCAVFLVCTLECDRLVALRRVGRELEVELDHDRVAGRHIGDGLTVVGLLDHERAFVEVRGDLRGNRNFCQVLAAVDKRQGELDALAAVAARRCDVLPVFVNGDRRQRAKVARHAGVRAVLGDIDVNRHGELHVFLNVRAVHLVVAPNGRPDRKVDGIDALFCRLRDGDGVFHVCAAVVGHIVQMADITDGGNIERPVADVLDGRRDGRLDGDVAQEIEVARQILAVDNQRH